jgi:hypothetical protein
MGVPFNDAEQAIDDAVSEIFESDPTVQSVGIGRHGEGYGFRVVRNAAMILPLKANPGPPIHKFQNIPVTFVKSHDEVSSVARVPHTGPGSPGIISRVPEQKRHRGLVCGLQIQNFDDDVREGTIDDGSIVVGTLGCFVRQAGGDLAVLSNNHVVAGQNRGKKGKDRILQPGGSVGGDDEVAVLTDFVKLKASPPGASSKRGTVILNDVVAGIATLTENTLSTQGYLHFRGLTAPSGTTIPIAGDKVFKVGRTTGLTRGTITEVGVTAGPINYDIGPCWFRRMLVILGDDGTMFSDLGDSGSVIVKTSGEVVGLLIAGNGTQSYACPIDQVLTALNCSLV